MRRALAWVLVSGLALPGVARASPAEGPVEGPSAVATEAKPIGTRSQQGTRRGGLELGLGVLLSGAAAGLVGFGITQFIRAREHVAFCSDAGVIIDELESPGIDPCMFDPPPLGFASAGLSWAFSLPLAVGAGMLFARGASLGRDARRYDRLQLSLRPWWQRRGAGASVRLRF